MARLMHDAAYKEMDEAETEALVLRMRELKELSEMAAELLELTEVGQPARSLVSSCRPINPMRECAC